MQNAKPSRKKWFKATQLNWLLKILLALLLAGALYFDLSLKDNLPDIWIEFLRQLSGAHWLCLVGALALMPLNWAAETRKWYQFVRNYQSSFSIWQAYKAVLAGVSFSIFTPNRVGEYGGRILFVKPKHQWKAIFANLVGNFAQIMVLLTMGTIGAIWFALHFRIVDPYLVYAYMVFASFGLALMLFAYFNIDIVVPLARRLPYVNHIRRFVKDVRVLRHYSRLELADVLLWASIRYAIYTLQYFLLLRFFGIEVDFLEGVLSISAIFLLQTSIPLPPVMGLLARGNVAVHVWSYFGANEVSILAATFGLWIINLILPAFFGTFFIFSVNITKSLGYEDDDA